MSRVFFFLLQDQYRSHIERTRLIYLWSSLLWLLLHPVLSESSSTTASKRKQQYANVSWPSRPTGPVLVQFWSWLSPSALMHSCCQWAVHKILKNVDQIYLPHLNSDHDWYLINCAAVLHAEICRFYSEVLSYVKLLQFSCSLDLILLVSKA